MSREEYRRAVAELLEQIDQERRRGLRLEAAGMEAPALEDESQRARRQLAELLR